MPTWFETSQIGQALGELVDLPETNALYKSAPPPFGHPMLKCFGFDPDYINLNHGESPRCQQCATCASRAKLQCPSAPSRFLIHNPQSISIDSNSAISIIANAN